MSSRAQTNCSSRPRTVAVMQPYFFPYAGYFRLFAVSDVFVIFDCVQFPRRGRVHRTHIGGTFEEPIWLTLPIARQARDILIRDVALAPGAEAEFRRRLERFRWITEARGPCAGTIREFLENPFSPVIDYLERGLRMVADLLDFNVELVRSSTFAFEAALRSQDRVIAVAAAAGARRYVNPPGGRMLYDSARFTKADIELCFLSPYTGRFGNMLHALLTETPEVIRRDIVETAIIESSMPTPPRPA